MKNNKNNKASLWRSIKVGLISLLVMVIFAYGFQVTKVNLKELRSETRQERISRVIRTLAKPDIFAYDQEEEVVNFPIYVPCPSDGNVPDVPEQDTTGPYLTISPACASPGETIRVEGFNFAPYTIGPLRFVPGSDPNNNVTLGKENAETDSKGHFVASMQIPKRLSNDVQYIRATLRRNVGSPHFTKNAYDTWEKIIETVFLALLATVFGTILAIPLSFIAARNLMKSVKSPLTSISLSI
jgi:phosphonate transport system permease protein